MLHTSPCGFGRTKQQPLSELRERTGLALRKSAKGADGPKLNKDETKLVRDIATASENRDWPTARSLSSTYSGSAVQIYSAAMQAALRCREYEEGSQVFDRCEKNCDLINQPAFSVALRIFAKLKQSGRVQQIWENAMKIYEIDVFLGSARLAAAADLGDVEMAAGILDQMNASNVSIDVYHINSAMRACWGWGNKQHRAAKYFFDLLEGFQLPPTVVSFTALAGAYQTASLREAVSVYNEMKALQIEPDKVFAETYLFSVLQAAKIPGVAVENKLCEKPVERLKAARDALADFEAAGLRLSRVCEAVRRELQRMKL